MNIEIVNLNYRKLLLVRKKNAKIFNKHLIKCLNFDNELDIRKTDEYYQCMNIILDNMNPMYESIIGRNCFNESEEDDLETSFNNISDKHEFLSNFFIFNKMVIKNTIYSEIDIKFRAVSDFFTLILKKEDVEILMKSLNKEINDILDIKKDNIVERVEIIDDIIQKIEDSIFTSKAEKKTYGEVFTKFVLINMMLDKLPEKVWTNPYLKWLDPANGYGNFPAMVVKRLMNSLKYVKIPETNLQNPILRYKWIMEKMIYVCDINPKNMKIYHELFDREYKLGLKLNFFRGDFRSKKFTAKMNEWGVKEFDIIIGNPPFDKQGDGRAEKLWTKFTAKSIDLLSRDGYLCFITPHSWLSGSANVIKGNTGLFKDYFSKYQLEYVNLKCDEYFDVSVGFSYYILKKTIDTKFLTTFDTTDGEIKIDIRDYSFLPPRMNKLQFSINNKTLTNTNNFEWVALTGGDKGRKNGVDEPIENKNIKTYVRGGNLDKLQYAYFDYIINPKVSNKRKIIIPISGAEKFMPFVDSIGIPICICSYIIYLMDNDILESAISVFNSKLFRFLIQENRSSGFIQVYIAKSLPKIDLTKIWTDNELYNHFNLTEDEKKYIEYKISDIKVKNTNIEDPNFKIGEKYTYTGKSKNINSTEVELVKILKTSFQIKDTIGNVSNVKKNTLKIKE